MALLAADVDRGHLLISDPNFASLTLSPSSAWKSFLRMLCSDCGPRRIGIGWIPPAYHIAVTACLLSGIVAILACLFPIAIVWAGIVAMIVAFATRPDVESFSKWTKRKGPEVARSKIYWADKLRASVAPYVMGVMGGGPSVSDYGVVTVITVTDAADYVYIYLGGLSRWFLLGWWNRKDDYNFDRILRLTGSKVS